HQVGQLRLPADEHGRRRQVQLGAAGTGRIARRSPPRGADELVTGRSAQPERGGQQVDGGALRPGPAALQVAQRTYADARLGGELVLGHSGGQPVGAQQHREGTVRRAPTVSGSASVAAGQAPTVSGSASVAAGEALTVSGSASV